MKDQFKNDVKYILDNYKKNISIDLNNVFYKNRINLVIKSYKETIKNKNIDNPLTFNEKISWIKIYDCSDIKTYCTDKIKVRNYCQEKLSKDIGVPILKIYNNVDDINLDELPQKFVLKCNHGCGFNIIVKDKSKLDFLDVKKKLSSWIKANFAYWNYELQYCNIDKKIYAEELLDENIRDYKIWCFHGNPFMVAIMGNRYRENFFNNHYDLNFNIMDGWYYSQNRNITDAKPKNFDEMLNYASILSKEFNYARIDFYNIEGKNYLGEITFTPNAGQLNLSKKLDNEYGKLLELNI